MEKKTDQNEKDNKMEDNKEINEKSSENKSKESIDNSGEDKQMIKISEEQEKFIMETLQKIKASKNDNDDEDEIKSEYRFWGTQPVPQFNKECPTQFGQISKDHKVEDLEKEPLSLPEGFEWKDMDLSQQIELDKLYEFLKSNYVEDDDHLFRFDYSKEFL